MNAKKAKMLREHFKPIEAEYVSTFHHKIFRVVDALGRPALVTLRLAQTRLAPGCGRAKYQAAKRAAACSTS